MNTITKEQAKDLRNAFQCWQQDYDPVEDKDQYDMFGLGMVAMDALLASLEAEAVYQYWCYTTVENSEGDQEEFWFWNDCDKDWFDRIDCKKRMLFTAPPAPVENTGLQRKAAIHDALCEKYNVESLTDFVDWQRNHIAELEAAPPAPVGPGETAVMPDYPGYVMTQRECYQAGKKAGLSEAGNSPVIPDGWVMVPVEPTYQMCEAMGLPWESPRFPDRYKAMIAAAPHFREIVNSSTNNFRENAETSTKCWCRTCRPITLTDMRFVVCPVCGNKRCPHANDHRNACSGSNEPGQEGSAYPAAPQQEVTQALAKGMERYGDAMQELAKKEVK